MLNHAMDIFTENSELFRDLLLHSVAQRGCKDNQGIVALHAGGTVAFLKREKKLCQACQSNDEVLSDSWHTP